jgi:hypothetical protein
MIPAGVNAKALSTFMGHANIAITLDLYGHLMPGSQAEAASLLDAYLVREIGGSTPPQLPLTCRKRGVEPCRARVRHLKRSADARRVAYSSPAGSSPVPGQGGGS